MKTEEAHDRSRFNSWQISHWTYKVEVAPCLPESNHYVRQRDNDDERGTLISREGQQQISDEGHHGAFPRPTVFRTHAADIMGSNRSPIRSATDMKEVRCSSLVRHPLDNHSVPPSFFISTYRRISLYTDSLGPFFFVNPNGYQNNFNISLPTPIAVTALPAPAP